MKREFGLLRERRAMQGLASGAVLGLVCLLVAIATASPAAAETIDAGWRHSCALAGIDAFGISRRGVKCWGYNSSGQLGDGTTTDRLTPVKVKNLRGATAITAGSYQHSCAVTETGRVMCWGYNGHGQLGDGTVWTRLTPVRAKLRGATAIAAGWVHTCALIDTGRVRCWGLNDHGQIGHGRPGEYKEHKTPVLVRELSGATAITAGAFHTCALIDTGRVKCWGNGVNGQLGNGTQGWSPRPVLVKGLRRAISVSAGQVHTCALIDTGRVKCWGGNYNGQLGDGTTTIRLRPVRVHRLVGATAVNAGRAHTCALRGNGYARCWGLNSDGQLGDGTTTDRLTPVSVTELIGATAVGAGTEHTCALENNGGAKCWGNGADGRLGDGTSLDRLTPVKVVDFP